MSLKFVQGFNLPETQDDTRLDTDSHQLDNLYDISLSSESRSDCRY